MVTTTGAGEGAVKGMAPLGESDEGSEGIQHWFLLILV
jgi:hypothetical protein